jgi:hypothetical protein
MGNLTGQRIDLTFEGLIKTNNEQPIDGILRGLQDGVGNDLPVEVSTTAVNFTGTVTGDNNTTYSLDTIQAIDQIEVNLNGANPTSQSTLIITAGTNITLTDDGGAGFTIDAAGGGGGAGLISGAGADSMQSAPTLTTNPANAAGISSIAIGNGAISSSDGDITIGKAASNNSGGGGIRSNIVIGTSANAGANAEVSTIIGPFANGGSGNRNVAIGNSASSTNGRSIAIGTNSLATQFKSICIGAYSSATGEGSITIGAENSTSTAPFSTALGHNADAIAEDAVAIGKDVTASTVSTVTIKKLQMLDYATIDFLDDAGAAAAGIPLGGVYHTNGTLKIRIV